MEIQIVNKSNVSTESLKALCDFLAPCYGKLSMPVRVTFHSKKCHQSVSGCAYYPAVVGLQACNPVGTYNVSINIGEGVFTRKYPFVWAYKARATPYTYESGIDYLVHTLAHELRHVEQFEACKLHAPKVVVRKFNKRYGYKRPSIESTNFGARFKVYSKLAFRSGSCEVDAEFVAHGLAKAYKVAVQNGVETAEKFANAA